jgi:hypothetical protein
MWDFMSDVGPRPRYDGSVLRPPRFNAETGEVRGMATERQIQETIARCVSIAVFYQSGEMTTKARALMAAEFQAVAAGANGSGLSGKIAEDRILRPVEAELVARYGPEAGRSLHAEVVRGFKGSAVPVSFPALA